jgi:hypothetical protein
MPYYARSTSCSKNSNAFSEASIHIAAMNLPNLIEISGQAIKRCNIELLARIQSISGPCNTTCSTISTISGDLQPCGKRKIRT